MGNNYVRLYLMGNISFGNVESNYIKDLTASNFSYIINKKGLKNNGQYL